MKFPVMNMTSTEIIFPSLNFTITLSAFDVCGRESEKIIGTDFNYTSPSLNKKCTYV